MRVKYLLTIVLVFATLVLIGFWGGSRMFCAALALWGFAVKPLIDYYFIRKRNLTHSKPLPWHFPFTQQYTWDLLFKKDEENSATTGN